MPVRTDIIMHVMLWKLTRLSLEGAVLGCRVKGQGSVNIKTKKQHTLVSMGPWSMVPWSMVTNCIPEQIYYVAPVYGRLC